MKNSKIKIITMLIIVLTIISFAVSSLAYDIGTDFDYKKTNIKGGQNVINLGNTIVRVVTAVGVVASVAILIILGIKYMLGSIEQKAQYKKSMMPYIIGATIVFAASVIANIIYNWGASLKP